MNRRQLLAGIGATALTSTPLASALVEFVAPLLAAPSIAVAEEQAKTTTDESVDARLRKDLSQLNSRANSEEGVPVFLACVNLVGAKSSRRTRHALTPFNAAVAAQFRENAAAWERIRPNSSAGDVGKLIEVLAARDFNSGGNEYTS